MVLLEPEPKTKTYHGGTETLRKHGEITAEVLRRGEDFFRLN
jgi:hypothetical protein